MKIRRTSLFLGLLSSFSMLAGVDATAVESISYPGTITFLGMPANGKYVNIKHTKASYGHTCPNKNVLTLDSQEDFSLLMMAFTLGTTVSLRTRPCTKTGGREIVNIDIDEQ